MVRKHYWHTRMRAKRSRPRTPAPKEGWLLAELAQLTQLPVRTLRYYAHKKLIAPIELRGTQTRYPRRALLLLLGIVRMQAQTRLSLTQIKRQLDTLGNEQLEVWLKSGPLPPSAANVLGLVAASDNPSQSANALTALPLTATYADSSYASRNPDLWRRVQLLPGLELMLCSGASPAVRRAAEKICGEYLSE